MTDKPSEIEDEPGAEERFSRGISNALKMPPKPHPKPQPEPGRKRGRPPVAN